MKRRLSICAFLILAVGGLLLVRCWMNKDKQPVDYVDTTIGGISHLLVPTFPTTQLPCSMLRVFPDRQDLTSEYVNGLPVAVTNHREPSAFKLLPLKSETESLPVRYNYDHETVTPYDFSVELADNTISVYYALSHQSAIYEISFKDAEKPCIALFTPDGSLNYDDHSIFGYQQLEGDTRIYVYLESEETPESVSGFPSQSSTDCIMMSFSSGLKTIRLRYGISLISCRQAEKNLRREIGGYDARSLAQAGRKAWNDVLGRIKVEGMDEQEKVKFYSFYYRTFERPICISEDGQYFSAYDHAVHEDDGHPFYTDDWLWDTYRAAHPLRCLTDTTMQEDILASFLRMARQKGDHWMPTFPEVDGDSRRMNSNHGVSIVAESQALGIKADYQGLYEICAKGIDEKTLAPWSAKPAGWIDGFYKQNGYIPALRPGETEKDPNVDSFEKRQPVAVTLGTAYDQWCLYRIARNLGLKDEISFRGSRSFDYRNLFNHETLFFHPKDKDGAFIEPIDYSFCGGLGARDYYGENNGWVYRWDVQHNIADLIDLMGGRDKFCDELDRTFGTPLSRGKFAFYAMLPDHTGNVGQFSMANEPALHIPYLYNYAGKPWKTQKRIRQMLDTWFRTDPMGIPGDEDGGGMSAFVVFSMMGFYPVTPGTATYNIGSPVFEKVSLRLANGNTFKIIADGAGKENKYIQTAELNGQEWNKPWFSYDDIKDGAVLKLKMGPEPNKEWGTDISCAPPSADIPL